MSLLLDSFWRAVAYCLHPRVIALSFLPLVIMVALALGLGYFYWDAAVEWVFLRLESWNLLRNFWGWVGAGGDGNLRTMVAPLLVILALMPVVIVLSLLVVAVLMTPTLVAMVAERRFPHLERKQGGSFFVSVVWSLGSTLLAVVALVVSLPLWLVPPLILILPRLIWGWLTYIVMSFDALAEEASKAERRELFRRHRMPLLGIGIMTGYLGAAPSIVWASGFLFVAAFVVLVPVAIWIYTLVFAFSSLWFSHYCLAVLEKLRQEQPLPVTGVPPGTVATSIGVDAPVRSGDVQPPSP